MIFLKEKFSIARSNDIFNRKIQYQENDWNNVKLWLKYGFYVESFNKVRLVDLVNYYYNKR